MNLEELKDRTVLLFGKSRAFSSDEFESQMRFHKIGIAKEYDSDVALVIEGKMMTPYEQNASSVLYEQYGAALEFASIDVLEKELASHIDADTLLMSIKLSHDKERLKSFLKNSMISDALFFRLLKMYRWGGEDFFENDDNRDVSAALILRFYKNIERNHNVQYATSGLIHLLAQTDNKELIKAILELEPLQKSNSVNIKIKTLIAMRNDCDEAAQLVLYKSEDESVLEALCKNENLSKTLLVKLLDVEKYARILAHYAKLDDELFETFIQRYPRNTAQNDSLTDEMQKRLLLLEDESVNVSLASNRKIDARVIEELLSGGSKEVEHAIYQNPITSQKILQEAYKNPLNHSVLACNENTPKEILQELGNSLDADVLKGLAQNPSTPVDVLYQLQLDSRFARAVKENASFGRHIQQENIGWEV